MALDPFLQQSQDQGVPQTPSLKAGQRLFNRRYGLKQPLGAGGMGVVWLARDHTEEIDVALKFLPSVLAPQEREMQRLREEVRAGKELRHEHLVTTFGMELEDGIAAIVMEYAPGQTLRQKIEDAPRGFLEPEEISAWVQDVCEGLSYLHEKARRIHRDLKPANIMIDAEGHAKLMDFGISHRIKESVTRHSKTGEGQASGSSSTLAYASPQQLKGEPSDTADDIYSLGATLYELMTGNPPFFRGGLEAVAHQIKTEPVTPILKRRQELVAEGLNASAGQPVPAAWAGAVLSCLSKTRERRPASARALWQVLAASGKILPSFSSWDRPRLKPKIAWAAALLVGGLGLWALVSKPTEVIKEVPRLVEGSAARQEAAQQRERADVMEKKAKEEEKKRLDAEAATAQALMAAATLPKTPLVGTPAAATKEAPFVNSLGMKYVPVPINAGPSKGQRVLFSIWETRSKDYAGFVKDSGHEAGEDWKTMSFKDVPVGRGEGESAEESCHPVTNVSHDEAVAFCKWLTKKDSADGLIGPKEEYRLPSDIEWSYAVGIGGLEDASSSPLAKTWGLPEIYPWGGSFSAAVISGNYADSAAKAKFGNDWSTIEGYTDGYATTAPVGSFKPNALGIYDLGGNLWEWTSSLLEPGSSYWVMRGASWFLDEASDAISCCRGYYDDGHNGRYNFFGFRCVLVAVGR